MTDLDYMKLAYKLAQKGRGKTSPNPMVGAVLVKANKVIAQGWHARCGADHAEVMVFKKAGQRARGAKLYVTLEPCYTVGRTPPCVNAVVANQIKEVIIGTKDPNPQTHGKSIQKLRRAGINTRVGFLRSELESLNEAFFKYQKYRMPFVTAKCAQTLDGKIATVTGDSKWITSKKTREFSRKKRNEFDAIIVGINTVLKDNPSLNPSLKTKRLKKIIIDSSLRIPMNAKLFRNTKPEDCILATTDQASSRKIKMLANRGFRVDVTRKQDHRVNLRSYFHRLGKEGVINILIEGGAHIIGEALQEKIVDRMHIYIAPKILGDQEALSSVVGRKIIRVNQSIKLTNMTRKFIEDELFIEGNVNN